MLIDDTLLKLRFPKFKAVQANTKPENLVSKQVCGVYILQFADGEFYIGQTVNLLRRFPQHRKRFGDIIGVSFRSFDQAKLNAEEVRAVKLFEANGFRLRNINIVKFSYTKTKFAEVMSLEEQEAWLNNPAQTKPGIRDIVNDLARSKKRARYAKFMKLPISTEIIGILREYVLETIPLPASTEMNFWSVGVTEKSQTIRLNAGGQMVLQISSRYVPEYGYDLICNFHLPRAYAEEVFDIDLSQMNSEDEDTFERLCFDETGWTDKGDCELIIGIVPGFLVAGDDDQVIVLTINTSGAKFLLSDDLFISACRLFNISLMQKRRTMWPRSHVYDLADHLLADE